MGHPDTTNPSGSTRKSSYRQTCSSKSRYGSHVEEPTLCTGSRTDGRRITSEQTGPATLPYAPFNFCGLLTQAHKVQTPFTQDVACSSRLHSCFVFGNHTYNDPIAHTAKKSSFAEGAPRSTDTINRNRAYTISFWDQSSMFLSDQSLPFGCQCDSPGWNRQVGRRSLLARPLGVDRCCHASRCFNLHIGT